MRISILDSFRALAIIVVMLYHFFTRWTPPKHSVSFYPYGDTYNFFEWGKLGVQFFFMISGFVIYFTLEKTENISSFWRKRIIRLLPSIIIASLITYIFFILLDTKNLFPASHQFKNFIPSITFIKPSIFNNFFNSNLSYLNDSYWSLWPEIQFYILSSFIYFFQKEKFIRNFLIVSIILILSNYLILNSQGSNILNLNFPKDFIFQYLKWIINGFNLITYLPFFSLGIIGYVLYKRNELSVNTSLFIKLCTVFLIAYTLYSGVRISVRIVYFLMILLFAIFIYYPNKLAIFDNPVITKIGESSYFLYLIHENIGVFLIFVIGSYVFPDSFIFPILLLIVFSYLSVLFYYKMDKPINRFFKQKLKRKKLLKINGT